MSALVAGLVTGLKALWAVLRLKRELASARAEAVQGFKAAILDMGLPRETSEELAAFYPRLGLPALRKAHGKDRGRSIPS